MKRIRLFLTGFLFLFTATLFAQNIQVTGTLTDATTGDPVPFASVHIKGTTLGTTTDDLGNFTLKVNPNGVLVISCIGYTTREEAVNGRASIKTTLQQDATLLEDLIVVGYGSAKKVGTVIGSVQRVTSKTLESRPQASAFESLQGQVAGLQVYTSSGNPGEVQSVRLHGVGSLTTSNTPLYVLDGIAVSSSTVLAMNQNDIESMSVLKDASATSIYGSRASNGVIYITSKRGSTSDAKISVRGQYGVSSMADKSFWRNFMGTEELWGFWLETGIKTQAQIDALKTGLINSKALRPDGSFNDFVWVDYMQPDNRPAYQGDISISGGAKSTTYYISAALYDETGTAPGTYYNKYSLRANLDTRVKEWFKMGINIALSMDNRQTNSAYHSNYTSGGLSFLRAPYYSPYDMDGKEPDVTPGTTWPNPYYQSRNNPDNYRRYGANISGYLEIEPIRNLKFRSVPGIDEGFTLNSWKTMPSFQGKNYGLRGEAYAESYSLSLTNTLEYAFEFSNFHKVTLLAGQEGITNFWRQFYGQSAGQTDDRLLHLNNGLQSTYAVSSSDTKSVFLSFFGRAEYSFDNKYFVDASVRRDASSRFGKNNKSAIFYAAGAMWNVKRESFLQNANWLNSLNIKFSYGTQGNASIGDYASLATVGETNKYNEGAAWVLGGSGNPDLSWEIQSKLTAGINTRLFDRINLGVEYYRRETANMLMSVPIPRTTGYSSLMRNIGSLMNNGVDISLGVDILKGKDYYFGVNANFNYNSEKVTKLFDGRTRWEIANTGVAYVVGKPVMFYYPIFAGIDSETGKQQWYLPGDDVDVTQKDPSKVTNTFNANALRQNTGIRRYAPINGGFNINGNWKGFGLNVDFAYILGKNLISNDRYFAENPRQFSNFNTSKYVQNYWKNPGDKVDYPNWKVSNVMQFDTHLVENASFLRLKNLTLSYSLPKSLCQKTKFLAGTKIFVTGRNIWTVKSKDFKGGDPEIDSNLTLGAVVNSKQYQVGLEITF